MCLIALALEQHPRFPLVIAANRDEFLDRPSAALDRWRAASTQGLLLGGRDLHAGGTWMGVGGNGRLAMVTNVRDLPRHNAAAASRGAIVPEWLATPLPIDAFWRATAAREHNPFNLLAGDIGRGTWWWADDRATAPHALGPGLYGLSNAALDTPWPKVRRLKRAMSEGLDTAASMAALESALFTALADRTPVPDAELPDTGVGLDRERWLAPAFIRTPDTRYGTRCSTLLIAERRGPNLHMRMVERQFAADGSAVSQRSASWTHVPATVGELPAVVDEPFSAA